MYIKVVTMLFTTLLQDLFTYFGTFLLLIVKTWCHAKMELAYFLVFDGTRFQQSLKISEN